MAKKKNLEENIYECIKCINSIEQDNKLHCKTMIKDLSKPYSVYSQVKIKKDCSYYKEK